MNPAPSDRATGAPSMNPRLSIAATCETPSSRNGSAMASVARANSARSPSNGVMSLKTMPDFGKSGTSRTAARRSVSRSRRRGVISGYASAAKNAERLGQLICLGQRSRMHVGDGRAFGAAAHRRQQTLKTLLRPGRSDLHRPVGAIPNPSAHTPASGLLAHEPAKADSLHLPHDDPVRRCHWRANRGGSRRKGGPRPRNVAHRSLRPSVRAEKGDEANRRDVDTLQVLPSTRKHGEDLVIARTEWHEEPAAFRQLFAQRRWNLRRCC